MAYGYAAATLALGAYNAYNTKKGLYSNANERDRAARESLLTAKYNINQRKKESRQTQFQVLETGGRLVGDIARAGLEAEGAAEVAGGSSGATIDSGSPRAALINIAQNALTAQTNVVKDTRNRIKSIARQTENQNRSEWRNAKLNEKQQKRIASKERKSADIGFKTDLIETGIKSYTAGATMSGTGDVSKWGAWGKKKINTTSDVKEISDFKGMSDAQRSHTSKYSKGGTLGFGQKGGSKGGIWRGKALNWIKRNKHGNYKSRYRDGLFSWHKTSGAH
jgi:hypothetical protein